MKWFKVDCDAQDNLDMKKLVDEWGWEWYGRYFAILGKVGMLVTEKHQTFALQTNDGRPFSVKLLSNELSTNVERLTNFLGYLSDNHLIDKKAWKEKSLIYCPKLKERADEYTKKLLTKSRHSPEQEVEVEVEVDKKKKEIERPTQEEVKTYFTELNCYNEAVKFYDHFQSNGWKVGGKAPMKDWKAAARNWKRRGMQDGKIKESYQPIARKCPDCLQVFPNEIQWRAHDCPKAVPPPKEFLEAVEKLANKMKV